MRVPLATMATFAFCLNGGIALAQDNNAKSVGIDSRTVAAYEKLGATLFGQIKSPDSYGSRIVEGREAAEQGLPVFSFLYVPESELPEVNVPFGLLFWHSNDTLPKKLGHLKKLQSLSLVFSCEMTSPGIKKLSVNKELTTLYLTGLEQIDTHLEGLAPLQSLRTLGVGGTQLTDAGLVKLTALKDLSCLDISYTKVTDAGIKTLARLENLTTLGLEWTQVTEVGLRDLAPLKKLTFLGLNKFSYKEHLSPGARVTDKSLRALREIGLLHALYCAEGNGGSRPRSARDVVKVDLKTRPISDAGLKELKLFGNLSKLNLSSTHVSELKDLAEFREISDLRLSDTPVSDEALTHLPRLKKLTKLDLSYTKITDAGLAQLSGFTGLSELSLQGNQITDEGMRHLVGLKRLTVLNLDGTDVTDAVIPQLSTLKGLGELNLECTRITHAGAEKIREALPECKLKYRKRSD